VVVFVVTAVVVVWAGVASVALAEVDTLATGALPLQAALLAFPAFEQSYWRGAADAGEEIIATGAISAIASIAR